MSYSHTTSPRSGSAHHLPAVRNTSIVLNFLSHSTTRPDWEREVDIIIRRCHSNAYNYCNDGDQQKFGYCFEAMIPDFLVRINYGFTPRLFASVLLTLAWAVEVQLSIIVVLSYAGQEDCALGRGRRATGWDFLPSIARRKERRASDITMGRNKLMIPFVRSILLYILYIFPLISLFPSAGLICPMRI